VQDDPRICIGAARVISHSQDNLGINWICDSKFPLAYIQPLANLKIEMNKLEVKFDGTIIGSTIAMWKTNNEYNT